MGYRSTFIGQEIKPGRVLMTSQDIGIEFPDWFVEKWSNRNVGFMGKNRCPIYARAESKTYGLFQGLEQDIQRVLMEQKQDWYEFIVVIMGEDGAIYRSTITSKEIRGESPTDWTSCGTFILTQE